MSVCYICISRGWKKTTLAGGTCVECSSFVCRHPSSRPDHLVHAYPCECGCKKLVCELDAIPHSSSAHGNTTVPSPCFSNLTLDAAPLAGAAAADLAVPSFMSIYTTHPGARQTPNDLHKIVNRFLVAVAPGGAAFQEAASPYEALALFKPLRDGLRTDEFDLRAPFFSEPRLAKVVSLAARAFAQALIYTDKSMLDLEDRLGRPLMVENTNDVATNAQMMLDAWRRGPIDAPDPMSVPDEPLVLARWLLAEDESSTPSNVKGHRSSSRARFNQNSH